MDWKQTLNTLAPTVATAFLGPLGGLAVTAIGDILGIDSATQAQIADAVEQGKLTPENIAKIKELEMQYQENEKERGFKYAELTFRDRDSARQANVQGGTQKYQFWLSVILLTVTLGCEVAVLFFGYPVSVSDIVVGRVLGLMDAVSMMVMAYHYGSNSSSEAKTQLIANSTPNK